MAKKYYVVWQGHKPGIYTDWATCSKQVAKYSGARYKSFPNLAEAEAAYGGAGAVAANGKATSKPIRVNSGAAKTFTAKEVEALTEEVKIFTDGGCEPNPGKAGSGLALYRKNELDELWYGLYNPMGTNNTAELNALHQAMIMGQSELKSGMSVAIFCDSKYSIQCITDWAVSWERKGWKKSGGEIKNLELIKDMFSLYQTIKDELKILHVNGHVGVEGNELADRMSIYAMISKEPEFARYNNELDVDALLAMRAG
ncbi:MAG: ribonuclease HI [Flavobacteriales bacterium]|jgi:ribonuclease HI